MPCPSDRSDVTPAHDPSRPSTERPHRPDVHDADPDQAIPWVLLEGALLEGW